MHPSQQVRQRQEHQFEAVKTSTVLLIRRLDDGTLDSRGETSRQRRVHRHNGTTLNGKQVGIRGILQDLTIGGIFLSVVDCFGFLEKNLQKIDRVCGQYTHKHCTYSAVQHNHGLGSRSKPDLHFIIVPQKEYCYLVSHVSSLVVSPAFHHEPFIFLIHSSFYDTRTRSTIGTTRATPRTLRRRETLSKTSLL